MDTRPTSQTHGTRSEALIWIDREAALIVADARDGTERFEILDRAMSETGDVFEARITDTVLDADRILILGPADMRIDFERTYVAITHRPDRLIDLESAPLRRLSEVPPSDVAQPRA
jgi:hypothetical protein